MVNIVLRLDTLPLVEGPFSPLDLPSLWFLSASCWLSEPFFFLAFEWVTGVLGTLIKASDLSFWLEKSFFCFLFTWEAPSMGAGTWSVLFSLAIDCGGLILGGKWSNTSTSEPQSKSYSMVTFLKGGSDGGGESTLGLSGDELCRRRGSMSSRAVGVHWGRER